MRKRHVIGWDGPIWPNFTLEEGSEFVRWLRWRAQQWQQVNPEAFMKRFVYRAHFTILSDHHHDHNFHGHDYHESGHHDCGHHLNENVSIFLIFITRSCRCFFWRSATANTTTSRHFRRSTWNLTSQYRWYDQVNINILVCGMMYARKCVLSWPLLYVGE